MMPITPFLPCLALLAPARSAGELRVELRAPATFVVGEPYEVVVELDAAGEGVTAPLFALGPEAFALDGEPLGARDETPVALRPGAHVTVRNDLSGVLARSVGAPERHVLRLDVGVGGEQEVLFLPARATVDFLAMPASELADYRAHMITNRGELELEFWPDVAPQHVRNFLDLSNTGFYDGSPFHRVMAGFMIQGGGSASGAAAPRKLQAEFNDRAHEPGVLSMARLPGDVNSATSEFFIVHARSPHLDGQYSAFGRVVEGMDVVDAIARCKVRGTQPVEPQRIERVVVYRVAPEEPR